MGKVSGMNVMYGVNQECIIPHTYMSEKEVNVRKRSGTIKTIIDTSYHLSNIQDMVIIEVCSQKVVEFNITQ